MKFWHLNKIYPQKIAKSLIFYIFFLFIRVATGFFGRKDENIKMHPKIAVFTTKTGQLSLAGLYNIFVLLLGRNIGESKTSVFFHPKVTLKTKQIFCARSSHKSEALGLQFENHVRLFLLHWNPCMAIIL